MTDSRLITEVPSFLIECAVFNVKDNEFSSPSNYQNCLVVLDRMLRACTDASTSDEWVEVNRLKYLFHPVQSWTRTDLRRLVGGAVKYLGAG